MASLATIAAAPLSLLTSSASLDPAVLLPEGRRRVPSLALDEYTAARLCASEEFRGSAAELACIVDVELNRAERRGMSLTESLTGGTGQYGPQGGPRPATTRRNPGIRHLEAARAVLSGELRGIARGAIRFFSPSGQQALFRKFKAGESKHVHSCSALGVLRAWSYDLPRCTKARRCCDDGNPPVANPGRNTQAWVGPIPDVNALRLMLLKRLPAGPEHDAAFEAARSFIAARLGDGGGRTGRVVGVVLVLGAAAGAARLMGVI